MRLIQFISENNQRFVGIVNIDGPSVNVVENFSSVRALALEAARKNIRLENLVAENRGDKSIDYDLLISEKRLLPPLDHPDPAHCLVTGTGLTHLGSAQSRDAMHAKLTADPENLSDSMKMFKLGLEGGKPASGQIGVAPEWFYKGDGQCIVAPEQSIELPSFADDGGEEAELVGLYVIDDQGQPSRVGFALGNEFSDHQLERKNYLYLAHSKLRQCSFGPEILIGEIPDHLSGEVRIYRQNEIVWSGEMLTGEANMSHTIANLEHHHFKYADFRRPGDVHVHYFGAAVLSCLSGFVPEPGDIFEISIPELGRALRNSMIASARENALVAVRVL